MRMCKVCGCELNALEFCPRFSTHQANPLADEVRKQAAEGKRLAFLTVNGLEAMFKIVNVGPEYLKRLTDEDVRRTVVY